MSLRKARCCMHMASQVGMYATRRIEKIFCLCAKVILDPLMRRVQKWQNYYALLHSQKSCVSRNLSLTV